MDDEEDIERPTIPVWFRLAVGVLAVIGAITVVRWLFGALAGLVKLAIVVALIALVVIAARSFKHTD